ncbi:hypothetical protein [Lentzea sp. NBRC 105346]|uniref:hypothetical protein n=1 Tax=Lentzea sp. NBRC 105346 TaxID=3032205 RepID=UPI0025579170|nr:hypothetical protein [Lentzea sp. NBRC 105346]
MNLTAAELLAHLAGQVPDDLLERARDRLADGDLAEVGRLVRFSRAAFGCTVPPDCYDVALTLFAAAGAPAEDVAMLVFPRTPVPPYSFVDGPLDLVADPELADAWCDSLDRAVVTLAGDVPGLRGVWRTWRVPLGLDEWRTKLYLAETVADPMAAWRRLRAVVGGDALLEVLRAGVRVPEYHYRARMGAALLWTDGVRDVPLIAPPLSALCSAEQVDGLVRTLLRRFLESGVDLPDGWRTDGMWVWPAGYAGYLVRHGVAPHGPLLDHARSRGFEVGKIDSVAEYRALAAVVRSAGEK